jgi:Uri superfamily endonuclease
MDKGIYCLVLRTTGCTTRVGALGELAFRKGWYVYVGSALGPGGLLRLQRHIALAKSKDKKPKWHIDYLTTHPGFSLQYSVSAGTKSPLECQLAAGLGLPGVPSFGCSDCSCATHLMFRDRDPIDAILPAFRDLGLDPGIESGIRRQ